MRAAVFAILLASALAVAAAHNDTDARCTKCGSSAAYVDVNKYCSSFSGWSQSCCRCIIQHESGGNANACNLNTNGSLDVGIFQINDVNWGQCNGGAAPCESSANTHCATMVWKWGRNTWKLWSTCGMCGCCGSA